MHERTPRLWLYPELGHFHPDDRERAMIRAKETRFDRIEMIGVALAVVMTLLCMRYSADGHDFVAHLRELATNFLIGAAVLVALAGPFNVRRVRRGLRRLESANADLAASESR